MDKAGMMKTKDFAKCWSNRCKYVAHIKQDREKLVPPYWEDMREMLDELIKACSEKPRYVGVWSEEACRRLSAYSWFSPQWFSHYEPPLMIGAISGTSLGLQDFWGLSVPINFGHEKNEKLRRSSAEIYHMTYKENAGSMIQRGVHAGGVGGDRDRTFWSLWRPDEIRRNYTPPVCSFFK